LPQETAALPRSAHRPRKKIAIRVNALQNCFGNNSPFDDPAGVPNADARECRLEVRPSPTLPSSGSAPNAVMNDRARGRRSAPCTRALRRPRASAQAETGNRLGPHKRPQPPRATAARGKSAAQNSHARSIDRTRRGNEIKDNMDNVCRSRRGRPMSAAFPVRPTIGRFNLRARERNRRRRSRTVARNVREIEGTIRGMGPRIAVVSQKQERVEAIACGS
jgi:hypothetical protein